MTPTHEELLPGLDDTARAWLDHAIAEARTSAVRDQGTDSTSPASSGAWELLFASVGRHCGQEHADAVRVLLLRRAEAGPATLARMYHQGSAAERRAVLLALPHLVDGPEALPLIEDALRTNDTRLVAAAVGPYGAAHLDDHGWRHAVLKCLFTEVPLDAVGRLAERAEGDGELARMLADYATERTAAGRAVPNDLHRALNLTGR